jgi:hypothetical protein
MHDFAHACFALPRVLQISRSETMDRAGAGQVGSRIAEGPRQIQAILVRMQARMEEQRLQASLQAERDSPVDVQVSSNTALHNMRRWRNLTGQSLKGWSQQITSIPCCLHRQPASPRVRMQIMRMQGVRAMCCAGWGAAL